MQRSRDGINIPCLGPEELELATTVYNRRKDRAESSQTGPRTPAAPAPADLPGDPFDTALTRGDTPVATPGAQMRTRPGGARAIKTCALRPNPYSSALRHGAPDRAAQGKRYCEEKMGATNGEWANERLREAGLPARNLDMINADFASNQAKFAADPCNTQMPTAPRQRDNRQRSKCNSSFGEVFRVGFGHPALRGWRHCPAADGEYGAAVRRAMKDRCGEDTPLPSDDEISARIAHPRSWKDALPVAGPRPPN